MRERLLNKIHTSIRKVKEQLQPRTLPQTASSPPLSPRGPVLSEDDESLWSSGGSDSPSQAQLTEASASEVSSLPESSVSVAGAGVGAGASHVRVVVYEARGLAAKGLSGFSDPYVEVSLVGATACTPVVRRSTDPKWLSEVVLPLPSHLAAARRLRLRVWDHGDARPPAFLGQAKVSCGKLVGLSQGHAAPVWLRLRRRSRRSHVAGQLCVGAQLLSDEQARALQAGAAEAEQLQDPRQSLLAQYGNCMLTVRVHGARGLLGTLRTGLQRGMFVEVRLGGWAGATHRIDHASPPGTSEFELEWNEEFSINLAQALTVAGGAGLLTSLSRTVLQQLAAQPAPAHFLPEVRFVLKRCHAVPALGSSSGAATVALGQYPLAGIPRPPPDCEADSEQQPGAEQAGASSPGATAPQSLQQLAVQAEAMRVHSRSGQGLREPALAKDSPASASASDAPPASDSGSQLQWRPGPLLLGNDWASSVTVGAADADRPRAGGASVAGGALLQPSSQSLAGASGVVAVKQSSNSSRTPLAASEARVSSEGGREERDAGSRCREGRWVEAWVPLGRAWQRPAGRLLVTLFLTRLPQGQAEESLEDEDEEEEAGSQEDRDTPEPAAMAPPAPLAEPVLDAELPLGVGQLRRLVMGRDPAFMEGFLRRLQCWDISVGPVTMQGGVRQRQVSYTMPLPRNPLGPRQCRCEETWRLEHSEAGGWLLGLHVATPTVPYGNAFHSTFQWAAWHAGRGRAHLRISCQVEFHRPVLVKGFINKSSVEGARSRMATLQQHLEEHAQRLEGRAGGEAGQAGSATDGMQRAASKPSDGELGKQVSSTSASQARSHSLAHTLLLALLLAAVIFLIRAVWRLEGEARAQAALLRHLAAALPGARRAGSHS